MYFSKGNISNIIMYIFIHSMYIYLYVTVYMLYIICSMHLTSYELVWSCVSKKITVGAKEIV